MLTEETPLGLLFQDWNVDDLSFDNDVFLDKSNRPSLLNDLPNVDEDLLANNMRDILASSELEKAPENMIIPVASPSSRPSSPEERFSSFRSKDDEKYVDGFARKRCHSLCDKNDDKECKSKVPRHKRQSHIKAEYKRRGKIQNGYEDLARIVPTIESSSSRDSKSSKLAKTADHIRKLKAENEELESQTEQLRNQVRALEADINHVQGGLPDSGASVSSNSSDISIEDMYQHYQRSRIFQNWKFWIFGMIGQSMFESYNANVRTSNRNEFESDVKRWIEQHCSLVAMRPILLQTLCNLSTQTSIMTKPQNLPNEALQAALGLDVAASQSNTNVSLSGISESSNFQNVQSPAVRSPSTSSQSFTSSELRSDPFLSTVDVDIEPNLPSLCFNKSSKVC